MSGMDSPHPLIVTAAMGDRDFAWADSLRRAHFPAGRNQVPAHISLFHHLPPSLEAELAHRLRALCAQKPPAAILSGVINLGGGVAYRVESPGLMAIRADLAHAFHGLLTPQDAATPRLHITVQNKVPPEAARMLCDGLTSAFRPRMLSIVGLAVWRYLGGPWEPVRLVRFRS